MKLNRRYIFILTLIIALGIGFGGGFLSSKSFQKKTSENDIQQSILANQQELMDKFSKVFQTYYIIEQYYIDDVDENQLLEGAIQGMLHTLEDPYTSYMDQEKMEQFTEQIEASFEGIGAEVTMVNGIVTIVAPIKDSPAEKASLRPNDQILKIDHENIEGLDLQEAVDKIRGEKGTEVTLEIRREGVSEPFEVTIVRDTIPLETVYSDLQEHEGKKIGLIEISSFSETTAEDFEKALTEFESKGIDGLVIDVRGNPGGLLDSVEDILGHFIPKDLPFIQTVDHEGQTMRFYTELEEEKEYPISVVIDEGSASASEILAIALKEIGHEVIGKSSFGKGTVQRTFSLGDNSMVKITIQKWLSPKGVDINEVGVEPTIEVNQPDYYYTYPIIVEEPFEYDQAGQHIENLQKMLEGLGFDPGRYDGYFDRQTEEAVKAFQQEVDLEVTGIVDEETAQKIESRILEKIRNKEDDPQLEMAIEALYR